MCTSAPKRGSALHHHSHSQQDAGLHSDPQSGHNARLAGRKIKSLPIPGEPDTLAAVSTKLKLILAKAVLAASPTLLGHPAETGPATRKLPRQIHTRPAEPKSRLNRILTQRRRTLPWRVARLLKYLPVSPGATFYCALHWLPCSSQVLRIASLMASVTGTFEIYTAQTCRISCRNFQ